jgi:hypothetical protein
MNGRRQEKKTNGDLGSGRVVIALLVRSFDVPVGSLTNHRRIKDRRTVQMLKGDRKERIEELTSVSLP